MKIWVARKRYLLSCLSRFLGSTGYSEEWCGDRGRGGVVVEGGVVW